MDDLYVSISFFLAKLWAKVKWDLTDLFLGQLENSGMFFHHIKIILTNRIDLGSFFFDYLEMGIHLIQSMSK